MNKVCLPGDGRGKDRLQARADAAALGIGWLLFQRNNPELFWGVSDRDCGGNGDEDAYCTQGHERRGPSRRSEQPEEGDCGNELAHLANGGGHLGKHRGAV